MRTKVLAFGMAILALIHAGCAAGLRVGDRSKGIAVGAEVGPPAATSTAEGFQGWEPR